MVVVLSAVSARADPAGDARLVYCSESGNHDAVVTAAIALGTVLPGAAADRISPSAKGVPGDLKFDAWRHSRAAEFERACAALIAQRKLPVVKSEPGLLNQTLKQFVALPSVVLGALLAWFGTSLAAGGAHRDKRSNDFHLAVSAYVLSCRTCLVAWRQGNGRAAEKQMEAPLATLVAELRLCGTRHRTWRMPALLEGRVVVFDADLRGDWAQEERDRPGNVELRLEQLTILHSELTWVAAAISAPRRSWLRMRATPRGAPT
ncbi:MAG: hypothetical protein ABIS86_09745 [Streptosporangiaceae bacterium]